MNRIFGTISLLSIAVALPSTVRAQSPAASPVTLVLMAGAALPMGDLDDIGNAGFTVAGGAEFGVSMLPFGLRAELGYTRFGAFEFSSPDGDVSSRPSNLAVTLNAIVGPTVPAAQIRPYFIGGVGFYNAKIAAKVSGSGFNFSGDETKGGLGLNGGAGVRFQFVGFSSFIEARYHHLFKGIPDVNSQDERWTSAGYLPIVFGVSIGG